MAAYDDEQQNKSRLQEGGEEGTRYGGEQLAKKLKGGAEESGKGTAKQAVKEGGKKVGKEGIKRGAQAAIAPETAGLGSAAIELGDQAQQAARDPEKAAKKGGMVILLGIGAVITSIIAILFVVIAIPVLIIAIIFGIVSVGEAAPDESSVLSVTKTANPNEFPNGPEKVGPVFKEVTYTVTITNTGEDLVTDIVISDDCGGAGGELIGSITPPGEMGAGASETITYKCKIRTDPPAYNDRYHTNTITVDGSISGDGGVGTNLDYEIPFRNTSVSVVNETAKKSQVTNNPNWPDNFVNTECESGVNCWDYVKQKAVAGGVNPAFVLAVWIAESGASHFSGHLSCPRGGVDLAHTVEDLKTSVNCFVNGGSPDDLFKGAGNYLADQFPQMIDDFCDPTTPEICQEPPDDVKSFLASLKSWYEILVPQGNPGALTTAGTTPTQTSSSATARVKIGDPPTGPPEYSPLKGPNLRCSGSDYWPTYNPDTSPCPPGLTYDGHIGLDIASSNFDVYSPFEGTATAFVGRDTGGACGVGDSRGVYILLTATDGTDVYEVTLAHLKEGSVTVDTNEPVESDKKIAVMGNTGTSCGVHIHYIVKKNGQFVDPKKYGALIQHP